MAKPYTLKRVLLTPQTWNILLDVTESYYPRSITLKGRMGVGSVDAKLNQKECRYLSEFFALQAKRLGKK